MDVLVVPSLWLENSPLVIHEAFMAGVPVVAARIGGIPDLVRDEEYGLLYDAESPAALAARLGRLIDDPDLLARLSGQRPRVKSIAQDAREWEERYSGLVAKSPG
jgi:glycosyltransferase involved in cell wall biosynthesis